MSFKELDKCLNEYLRSLKALNKAEKRAQVLNARKQRNEQLTRAAKQMRARGASEGSIQRTVKTFNDYFDLIKKPVKPDNSESTPVPNVEAPGLLLSEVETQPVAWLWEKRIPLGKITVLDGDPGMGKSLIAAQLAACVSTGRPMPDGTPGKQGGVILIAPEDSAEDTLKPRLEAAGGDPSQVLLLNTVEGLDVKRIEIRDRPFSLSHDLDTLEKAIKRMQAVLVILDPLTAVLGHRIDSSRDQDVREVFTPLAQLAERTGCAVLIIRHLSRSSAGNPLYRGAGSIGIIAAARIGLIVTADPSDENKRLLATTKNNLSKQASNLTYQVVDNTLGVPYIQWLEENHHPVKALFNHTNLSYERQAILKVLKDSSSPLRPGEVANRTELNHTNVRKMLPRLLHAGEIASPARGLYTALEHSSLPSNLHENRDVPTETIVTNVSTVSNDEISHNENNAVPMETSVSSDEISHNENLAVPTETSVPSMTSVSTVSSNEIMHIENNAVPMETNVPSMTSVSNVSSDEISHNEIPAVPTETSVSSNEIMHIENNAVPMETNVPSMTSVSNVSNHEISQKESNAVPTETYIPSMTYVLNVSSVIPAQVQPVSS